MTINELWISMRAEDAVAVFERVVENARQAAGQDGAFEVEIDAEPNTAGGRIRLVFCNDDMEREEMTGRTIVDWE
jgi:hypothetical protein